MIPGFSIVMDREKVDLDLLRCADGSLSRVMRYLNICTPYVGISSGRVVAICLLEAKEQCYDIVNLSVAESERAKGYDREILTYVLESVRAGGGRFVETGCSNANFGFMAMVQEMGFRFIGVWQDYYLSDTALAAVENSILIRDMVRFRIDLYEKRLSTIGYDASGRT